MNNYEDIYKASLLFVTESRFNSFKVAEWNQLLDCKSFDIDSYNRVLLYFSVNIFQAKMSLSSLEPPRFLKFLEKEVYNTLSDKENKGKTDILLSSAISGLSTLIATKFDLDPFVVGGFLNLIILSIYKIGVDAWCTYYKEKSSKK